MKLPTPYQPGTAEPTAYYTNSDLFDNVCIKCAAVVEDNKTMVRAGYALNEWLCADCADLLLAWLGDPEADDLPAYYVQVERAKYPLLNFKANRAVLNSI
jgi:hypothetical protein